MFSISQLSITVWQQIIFIGSKTKNCLSGRFYLSNKVNKWFQNVILKDKHIRADDQAKVTMLLQVKMLYAIS